MFINVARLKIFQNKVNNEFKNNIFKKRPENYIHMLIYKIAINTTIH